MSKMVSLAQFADILGGFAFKSYDFQSSGVRVVKIANIEPPSVNLSNSDHIAVEKTIGLDRFRLKSRDILIAMTGATIGKVGRYRSKEPAYLNQRVAKISSKAGSEFDDFIFAVVSQKGFDHQIINNSSGSAQANVSTEGIGKILVPNFSQSEQLYIGKVIASLDDKIELNRQMNITLEAIVQAIFKSWFVDAAEEGLPNGWRTGILGDIAENHRHTVLPEEIEPATPFIGLEHMPRRCIALSEWSHEKELGSNKFRFKKGEILFGKLRPYFHKVGIAPLDGVCSTDILVVAPKEPAWFGFVLGHMSSIEFVNYTDAGSTGTKMPRTDWNTMARYTVAIPPKQMATAFNDKVHPMVDRIIANIHESRTLAALRDALLPKLMSGEIKVP